MKKFRKPLIIFLILALALSIAACGKKKEDVKPPIDDSKEAGEFVGDQTRAFWKEYSGGAKSETVAKVLDQDVTKAYFEFKYAYYGLTGKEKAQVIERIKKEIYDRKLAAEQSLYPSKEEIDEYINDLKELFASSNEATEEANAIFEGMGVSAEEYWTGIGIYFAENYFIDTNVAAYMAEHNMSYPEIDFIVLDEAYFNKFK